MPSVSTLTQQNDSSFKFPIPKRKPHTQKNSNQQHPPIQGLKKPITNDYEIYKILYLKCQNS